jgi:shikimate kinase
MSKAIYLVGFMGSGKSTIGRLLAKRMGMRFVDLDDDIEKAEGRSIADVFSNDGEARFRDAEHAALAERVRRGDAVVLALGGGAFTFARNRELLAGAGTSVWLDCPFERASERVARFAHRPLAKDPAQFRALFDKRQADYSLADLRIPISSDDPEDAVRLIVEALR